MARNKKKKPDNSAEERKEPVTVSTKEKENNKEDVRVQRSNHLENTTAQDSSDNTTVESPETEEVEIREIEGYPAEGEERNIQEENSGENEVDFEPSESSDSGFAPSETFDQADGEQGSDQGAGSAMSSSSGAGKGGTPLSPSIPHQGMGRSGVNQNAAASDHEGGIEEDSQNASISEKPTNHLGNTENDGLSSAGPSSDPHFPTTKNKPLHGATDGIRRGGGGSSLGYAGNQSGIQHPNTYHDGIGTNTSNKLRKPYGGNQKSGIPLKPQASNALGKSSNQGAKGQSAGSHQHSQSKLQGLAGTKTANPSSQHVQMGQQQALGNGIRMGENTAQKAAAAGKAATHLSTGNVLMAAKEAKKVVGGDFSRKMLSIFLIGLLAFTGIMSVFFTYALPSSQYEVAETYTKDYYKEKYQSGVYGSDGDINWARFVEGIKIGAEVIKDNIGQALSGLLGDAFNIFNNDNQQQGIESFSEDGRELRVAQVEAVQTQTLKDKISAVQKKINARSEDITEAINDNEGDIKATLANAIKANGDYDEVEVNVSVQNNQLSDEGAAAIMGLYMVQEGGSLDDVRLSSLLKWLGYYNSIQSDKLDFKVFDVPCKVKTWQGTFLPQYLNEQKKEEIERYDKAKTNFEDYQTAAADLIVAVDVPSLEEIPVYESQGEDEEGNPITIGMANVTVKIQPRELQDIADLMGLWIGDLSKDQARMMSNLSVNMISSAGTGEYYGSGDYEWIEGGELDAWTPMHDLYSNFVGISGQCTWYAADRLYQLNKAMGKEFGVDLTGYHMGNGGEWSANARQYGFKVDHVAAVGKAACFVPGQTMYHSGDAWAIDPVYGHIAIVEKVNPDGSILVSEFWGSVVDYKVHFSTFSKETAAQIDYIDFTQRS